MPLAQLVLGHAQRRLPALGPGAAGQAVGFHGLAAPPRLREAPRPCQLLQRPHLRGRDGPAERLLGLAADLAVRALGGAPVVDGRSLAISLELEAAPEQ